MQKKTFTFTEDKLILKNIQTTNPHCVVPRLPIPLDILEEYTAFLRELVTDDLTFDNKIKLIDDF